MERAYVVCRVCLARFDAPESVQPRSCETPDCEAGWLDLPMFADAADADRAAGRFAAERGKPRAPLFS